MTMDIRNRYTSLKDKLKQHYETRKKTGKKPSVNFLNSCAPTWYIIVIFGVAYLGIFDALPKIYGQWNSTVLHFNTYFCCFMFIEIMINWLCIHFVSSSYLPSIHGFKRNDDISDVTTSVEIESDNYNNGFTTNGSQTGSSFKIYVASGALKSNGTVERTEYPYWSWVPCLMCQRLRPPRCHHCTLCKTCVLKRDHHCFFARACVGINNQRHFVVFLFWALVGTVYSNLHMVIYFYYEVLHSIAYIDIIPPIALLRAIFGYQTFFICFQMILLWALPAFLILAFEHFCLAKQLILESATSFEVTSKIHVMDTRSFQGRLRSVFGHYWAINFVIPLHFWFKPVEDPVYWPSIKT